MADRIIKPDSGNDVVIQNNGGTRKIKVTNTGDVEVTGDFKATTVKATNLKANDGTAALVISDSSGNVSFNDKNISNVGDISLDTISSDAGTSIGVTLGTDSGDDFNVGSGKFVVEGDTGNVGIGTTSPGEELEIYKSASPTIRLNQNGDYKSLISLAGNDLEIRGSSGKTEIYTGNADGASSTKRFFVNGSGIFGFNAVNDTTTAGDNSVDTGFNIQSTGRLDICTDSAGIIVNRISDGTLISFRHIGTSEGSISVSGSTVSYNGGHLSRWSYLPSKQKDESFLKGTVLTNLDAMCEWEKDTGEKKDNEQLNQVNISTVEGDPNVAGVFVNWGDFDEAQYTNTHDLNMAMTGDMIIRIANGVTVEKGQLLMSAGDGTAKPQGDDIVKNKTIAKVTSNHVTCTYDDGSYCVPCVLMAC